ncbi:PhnE/PtxC family ABC transporter permease [Dethiothermospora halolimnae]|uniref:PhnE/PtxC family ABC transporter permease n=1 Tax=Dethiothermospora halolimnae TaxID=3114390 RepID=UPI003CCB7B8D
MISKTTKKINSLGFIKLSLIIFSLLVVLSWLFIFNVENADLSSLFSDKNINHTKTFSKRLLGIGEKNPAFKNIDSIKNVLKLTVETLIMSIIAIGFSSIVMLLMVVWGSRNVADGTLTLSRRWYNWIVFGLVRVLYIFSRAIPELIWAMIIVFIFKPGILPGAIALSLHNFGILGKLCSEVIEDLDLRPIRNLASSGASKMQMLIYGVIPMVTPKFITFILYRWEVIIRTTIVVGFVGAGGLGMQFKLSMSWFHYSEITLLLISYVLLVIFSDIISQGIRKLIK